MRVLSDFHFYLCEIRISLFLAKYIHTIVIPQKLTEYLSTAIPVSSIAHWLVVPFCHVLLGSTFTNHVGPCNHSGWFLIYLTPFESLAEWILKYLVLTTESWSIVIVKKKPDSGMLFYHSLEHLINPDGHLLFECKYPSGWLDPPYISLSPSVNI